MTVRELLERQAELEALLRNVGPVQFLRALRGAARGAQVRAHDSRQVPGGQRATRFVFVDPSGVEAFVTVVSQLLAGGQPRYSLEVEARLGSA